LPICLVFRGITHDPIVYGGTAVLLLSLGLFAAFVPARRAARVDPMVALRMD
jgi:ABC-type antimicrobial peptide transport system permease subunit